MTNSFSGVVRPSLPTHTIFRIWSLQSVEFHDATGHAPDLVRLISSEFGVYVYEFHMSTNISMESLSPVYIAFSSNKIRRHSTRHR
jgi:hypothetical protein